MADDLPIPTRKDPVPPETVAPNEGLDAGSQALSEALRSSFGIVKVVMVVLVIVFLGSGFFTVGPQERAIILRFGRPVGTGEGALLGPGPHWSWPYPIDECVKVSITGIQKAVSTVGWYATTPDQELAGTEPPPGMSLNPAVDGYAMTGDGNIIHTRATLTYRISDPIRYVFNYADAAKAVTNALDNALLQTAARFKVDDILTRDLIGFSEAVRRRVTELVSQQNLGISVEQCPVQSIPPRQLKDAFANVLKSEVMRNTVLNAARGYENQVTSRADADAGSRVNIAESDRTRLISDVSSRSEQFMAILPKYRQSPGLFVQQSLNETMGRVLTNVQDKIFLTESANGKEQELRLLLNREPPRPRTDTNAVPGR
jgi:membrane protease subunit HflK